MIQNLYRFLGPFAPGLMKRPYQFSTFGINADNRHCVGFVTPYLVANIAKLQVSLPGIGRFALPGFKAFKREKFICFSNLPTVLDDTRMPSRLNCWAILPVVLRVHLQPLTGSPAVLCSIMTAFLSRMSGVFFPAKFDRLLLPGLFWNSNHR